MSVDRDSRSKRKEDEDKKDHKGLVDEDLKKEKQVENKKKDREKTDEDLKKEKQVENKKKDREKTDDGSEDDRPKELVDRIKTADIRIKIGVVGVVLILMISSLALAIMLASNEQVEDENELNDRDIPADNPLNVHISEIDPYNDWFELYLPDGNSDTISGWKVTTFDESPIELPELTGINGYEHVIVYSDEGMNDLDCSDGEAAIFLGEKVDLLEDTGDELAIFDSNENLVDFVAWGSGNGDKPMEGWSLPNYLPAPVADNTLSIQGPDMNEASYWTEGPSSPLGNSIFEIPIDEYGWSIFIENGRKEDVVIKSDYMLDIEPDPKVPSTRTIVHSTEFNLSTIINITAKPEPPPTTPTPPSGNGTSGNSSSGPSGSTGNGTSGSNQSVMKRGPPLNESRLKDIAEYADFTFKLLKKLGFGDALETGMKNGKPYIKIVVTNRPGQFGSRVDPTGENAGTIHINLGSDNKYVGKHVVEHEITHAFQVNLRKNEPNKGTNHLGPLKTRFLEEGMAEFIGRYSTMKNFNTTWQKVEEELKKENMADVYTYSGKSHMNIFTNWPNGETGPYGVHVYYYYATAYLFYKFLFDKYGMDIMQKIFNATIYNYPGHRDNQLGIEAIEKATGKKFEDLLQEFMLYRLENRFPQYKDDPNFNTLTPDKTITFTGAKSEHMEWVEPYGSRINRYIMNGKKGKITFKTHSLQTRWMITIVKIAPNGTRTYEKHIVEPNTWGYYEIGEGLKEVIVIKTLLSPHPGRNYGRFNISIETPAPSNNNNTTPNGTTPNGRSINTTQVSPKPNENVNATKNGSVTKLKWKTTNGTTNTTVRVQISPNGTFTYPGWEYVLPWHILELILSEIIQTGPYWWRLRWEDGDAVGEWSTVWKFILWKTLPPPEILWDPQPHNFEQDLTDHSVVIPSTTVTISDYILPEGMTEEDGIAQFKIGHEIIDWTLDTPFDIGQRVDENDEFFEMRVFFPNTIEWPWITQEIIFDEEPPEVVITSPENGSRFKTDLQIDLQLDDVIDGKLLLGEPEWNISYTLSDQTSVFISDMIAPGLNAGEYSLELDVSTLLEGEIVFKFKITDVYGRTAEVSSLSIMNDRTAPDLQVATIPAMNGTNALNGSFQLLVRSQDDHVENVQVVFEDLQGLTTTRTLGDPVLNGDHWEWTYQVESSNIGFTDGMLFINTTIIDDLGNSRRKDIEVDVDMTAPELMITAPADNHYVMNGTEIFVHVDSGEHHPMITKVWIEITSKTSGTQLISVDLDNPSMDQNWEKHFDIPSGASPGEYWLTAYAQDWAGNIGTAKITLNIE